MAKLTKRTEVSEVTLGWVRRMNSLLPDRLSEGITGRSDKLATQVLLRFLGSDWIERYISSGKGFLQHDAKEDWQKLEMHRMRRIVLAEMLFNLQRIDGFKSCLLELAAGQIEATYAALEIARLIVGLALDKGLKFRFVPSSRAKRRSYDLAITFSDGVRVCAETKCKLEETAITLDTIERSISDAKKQLPLSVPGIVFVKLPRQWINDEGFLRKVRALAQRSMSRTSHIVSVKFYVSSFVFEEAVLGKNIGEVVGVREETSANHQFRRWKDRRWHMFPATGAVAPPPMVNFNGMRAPWQKILVQDHRGFLPMQLGPATRPR